MIKRLLSLMLSLVLLLSMATIVQAEDDELEILNNPPKNHVYNEIAFKVGTDEITIFGFVDKEGTPQFRIYGKVGKTKGFFPITITGEGDLVVESAEPVKDNKKDFGKAKIASEKVDIPQGFVKTNKKNIFRLVNIFNETEHVAYASYDGENYYYFLIGKNNQPLPGSFPMDLEDMNERSKKNNNNKKIKKPAEFKKGFSKGIILLTSDGHEMSAYTSGPVLDVKTLIANKGRSFGWSGSGSRGGSNSSSSNSNVKFAQGLLKKLGFLKGAVDGKFGEQTKAAVIAFQAKNGLVQTGSLDAGTMAKLRGETAVNSAGKTVQLKPITEAADKAAAQAAVAGVVATVSISKKTLSTTQEQTFTTKVTKNPNGLNNFSLVLTVSGPEGFTHTFPATGGSINHKFSTDGSYRALLYIKGPAGNVGADYKDYKVIKSGSAPSGPISQEDADNDSYLAINLGGSHNTAVEKGSSINISANLARTVPGHNYKITVSGPGYTKTVNGTSFNDSISSDGTAKDYTVTATGNYNGKDTNTVTGTFKVLAAGSGGSGGSSTEKVTLSYTHSFNYETDRYGKPSNLPSSILVDKDSIQNFPTLNRVANGGNCTGTPDVSSNTMTGDFTVNYTWDITPKQVSVTFNHGASAPPSLMNGYAGNQSGSFGDAISWPLAIGYTQNENNAVYVLTGWSPNESKLTDNKTYYSNWSKNDIPQ